MKDLGQKIKELRKEKKLSQNDLGKIISVCQNAVSRWECGKAMPDIYLLSDMADYFEVSIDYLLGRED